METNKQTCSPSDSSHATDRTCFIRSRGRFILIALLIVASLVYNALWSHKQVPSQSNIARHSPDLSTRNAVEDGGRAPFPFATSASSWSMEQVAEYEYRKFPNADRNKKYSDRVRDQAVAEMANNNEVVRYITNVADMVTSKEAYQLLIRVLLPDIQESSMKQTKTKKRWNDTLDRFQLPSFINVRVDFISSGDIKENFSPAKGTTDWIFVVQESTYVHLSRLVHRLFADVDPTMTIRQGLLTSVNKSMVPILEAGILFSQKALIEVWDHPRARSCWNRDTSLSWCVCLAKASFAWTSLPGLNPYDVRKMLRWSLERSLFTIEHRTYESVGGSIIGTARLPITYGQMIDDDLFYDQLAVDTNQGRIPKTLHHIWVGSLDNMPLEVRDAAKRCQQMHEEQGWKYMFWDDTRLKALPGLPQLDFVLSEKNWVRKYADTIRLYLLHQFGGVYLDMDSHCLRPFDPLLGYLEERGMDFIANYESEAKRGRQIANGIIIAAPASPVLSALMLHLGTKFTKLYDLGGENQETNKSKRVREVRVRKPEKKKWKSYRVTGPWLVTEVREQWDSWVRPHQVILSSAAFIPVNRNWNDLTRDDVFAVAARKGSYTIQMYQSQKSTPLYALLANENQTLASSDGKERKMKQIGESLLARENKTFDDSQQVVDPQRSILMIVAHPDDEVLWGGEFLLEKGSDVHVVVTCTKNRHTPTRRSEFRNVEQRLGYHGEFLDGKDTMHPVDLESRIKLHIQKLVCGHQWEKIVTHGPEGEYGHPQHHVVHDAVLDAVKICCRSADRLFVFQPLLSDRHSSSKEKDEVAELYKSQQRVIFKSFGNWMEQIVRFAEYDFKRASDDCIAAKTMSGSKSRICRLHKQMNFSSRGLQSHLDPGVFEAEGIGC